MSTVDIHGPISRSRIDTNDYAPMMIEGETHGEVHWFRNDEREGVPYQAAVWRLTAEQLPYVAPYEFRTDETVYVLEGELHITFENGETAVLREGDVACFQAGTRSQWRIERPFKKFVVAS